MLLQPIGTSEPRGDRTSQQSRLYSANDLVEEPAYCGELSRIKALIFDVDGTLYQQTSVRGVMAYRLLRAHLTRPRRGLSSIRALRAYRKAQETLRKSSKGERDIAAAQLQLACQETGFKTEDIAASVGRWMEQEPLDLLANSLREGLLELLRVAERRGLRLGVFSDYPAGPKLTAMGIEKFFDVVVSAQDPEVQRFKPDPKGLQVVMQRLGVERHEALYVGDRRDVDAVAATRAGMRCVIVGGRRREPVAEPGQILWMNFRELTNFLCKETL